MDPTPTVKPTEEPIEEFIETPIPESTEGPIEQVVESIVEPMQTVEVVVDGVGGLEPIVSEPDSIDPSIVKTYTMNNDGDRGHLPGSFLCDYSTPLCTSGSDIHADEAHANAYMTLAYYNNYHNRNSIDNAGMDVISSVHFDSGYNNAFWDGEQMVYGDGQAYPLADDVVAHEITHGVTSYESKLFYYYQSGAINEAFSDLWGEFFDLNNPSLYDDPTDRWGGGGGG